MSKYETTFHSSYLNAAGTLGFAPDPNLPCKWESFGAFLTNPISRIPRKSAHGTRFVEFTGGFLIHTGHPNPGMEAVSRRYAKKWAQASLPIIIHILASNPEETANLVQQCEELDGIRGVELGLDASVDPYAILDLVTAAMGELPVWVRLPLNRAAELGPLLVDTDIAGISLGPPRGALPTKTGEIVQGRLYGPAIFPLALSVIQELVGLGVSIIGAGGIYTVQDAEAMLRTGATAVQLDSVFWRSWNPLEQFNLTGDRVY